jgi:Arc/MetJ-type ribon-helix-helix transcriptional regulator
MSRSGFKSLTIPEGLYKALENYVEQSIGYYVSISEVVRKAIRDYLADKSS